MDHLSGTREINENRYTLIPCEMCKGSKKGKRYDGDIYDCSCVTGTEGVYNSSADLVERVDIISSDSNLTDLYDNVETKFNRFKCGGCGGVSFEVLQTGSYETTAQCVVCGAYYEVHNG